MVCGPSRAISNRSSSSSSSSSVSTAQRAPRKIGRKRAMRWNVSLSCVRKTASTEDRSNNIKYILYHNNNISIGSCVRG